MIVQKRMTGKLAGEFVEYLIGMRVNRWWKPWQWLRSVIARLRSYALCQNGTGQTRAGHAGCAAPFCSMHCTSNQIGSR